MLTTKSNGALPQLVGKEAPEAYTAILNRQADLEHVWVCRYPTPPLLQERVKIGEDEQRLIDLAMSLRSAAHVPFWEALFAVCLQRGECPDSLLNAAGFHHGPGELHSVSRDQLRQGALSKLAQESERNVGITSKVTLSNSRTYHMPLLDFHCELSEANADVANRVCRRLMPEGFVLLDSGDSYHACGLGLLDEQERFEFYGKALFFAPIVDSWYVAHQLLQPAGSIRISRGGHRGKYPTVLVVEIPSSASQQ